MPTLEWIGKDKVINHHQEVPYRVLDRKYSFDADGQHDADNGSENMIIHGDNLEALKSLLPRYEGKIKCIYIDPPYNTGNENWVYNDNVNDPRIRKWLGEVVGKEGEDLSRHDKWLCMMYPRLKLLHKLMADDGVIFISIDDNELYSLKFMCDEIFGANCFVANVSWQRSYSPKNDSKGITQEKDHILVYGRSNNWQPRKLPRTDKMNSKYKNPDGDTSPWRTSDAFAPGAAAHQGMVYAIQHPFTGKMIYPYISAHWPYQQETMLNEMRKWGAYELKDLNDAQKRAEVCGVPVSEVRQGVLGIVLSKPIDESRNIAKSVLKSVLPRFFFTKKGQGGIARKTYLSGVEGTPPTNLWLHTDVGHTDEAKKILKAIFEGNAVLDTPKPPRLIERVLHISGDTETLILDSFAGSGTTAHAVLNMNKRDGGSRKFILIEMMDYADSVTAERVKRVIRGYGEGKNAVEGTGGDFSYYELGEPLLIDGNLNDAAGTNRIREYIWFMETRTTMPPASGKNPYYLGICNDTAYYFYYEADSVCTLNHSFLSTIRERASSCVIYADLCTLSAQELLKMGITFKKIPRDISKL